MQNEKAERVDLTLPASVHLQWFRPTIPRPMDPKTFAPPDPASFPNLIYYIGSVSCGKDVFFTLGAFLCYNNSLRVYVNL